MNDAYAGIFPTATNSTVVMELLISIGKAFYVRPRSNPAYTSPAIPFPSTATQRGQLLQREAVACMFD